MKAQLVSGEWAGHYEQGRERFPQRMTLEFADGIVRGDGIDGLGPFRLEGEYRATAGEVRLGWIKTYDGSHSILYVGALDPDGTIVGEWRIPPWSKGAFALQAASERT